MIHWQKIDTDPDSNLLLALTNMLQGLPQQRQIIISVTAIPGGYVILSKDPDTLETP